MSAVLVTGAGQGIGRAIALRLANDGHDIALVDLAEDKIAAAERTAIAEVRAKAANAATAAAAALIAERHDAAADQLLVDKAIGGIGSTRLN